MMDENTELLGMSEAARRLRVHVYTLRRWSTSGKLVPLRDSAGRRLFFAEDVDKLARERGVEVGEGERLRRGGCK